MKSRILSLCFVILFVLSSCVLREADLSVSEGQETAPAAAVPLAAASAEPEERDVDDARETDSSSPEGQGNALAAAVPLAAASDEPEGRAVDDTLKAALISFTDELFRRTVKKENTVLSPLSAYIVLAMTANGARGDTLAGMETALGLDNDSLNEYLYSLTNALAETEGTKVTIANSLWGNADNFSVSPDFAVVAEKFYRAEAESLPFSSPDIVKRVNSWVSEHTDGMIPVMLAEPPDADAVMLLLNTVLFDGVWEREYGDAQIRNGDFICADGSVVEARYLISDEGVFRTEGAIGFSKTYLDGYRFVGILPDGDPAEFAASANLASLIEASSALYDHAIVYLPCFEYETTRELNRPLTELGMEKAFNREYANFTALSADGRDDLCISLVTQKAKITLNEHGTKAAAATAVEVVAEAEPQLLSFDRPFFYVILTSDGLPLFLGTVYDPTQ